MTCLTRHIESHCDQNDTTCAQLKILFARDKSFTQTLKIETQSGEKSVIEVIVRDLRPASLKVAVIIIERGFIICVHDLRKHENVHDIPYINQKTVGTPTTYHFLKAGYWPTKCNQWYST